MAENQHPRDPVPPPPRLDLSALSKSKKRTRPTPTPSPMTSGRIYNVDTLQVDPARMQLISPPPEETLRRVSRSTPFTPSLLANPTPNLSTSKRKRSQQQVASVPPSSPTAKGSQQLTEATPNPKPRKQTRRHARTQSMESPTRPSTSRRAQTEGPTTPSKPHHLAVQSPHTSLPDADYIPPVPLSLVADGSSRRATISARARRSATPIPPYEPPKDVFTPPREVFITPTISKSSKRKSTVKRMSTAKSKKKHSLKIDTSQGIKLEMPDIDLTEPMPPASPTDDPLLLSGSVEPSSPIKPREPVRVDAGVSTSPPDDNLNDISRTHLFDWDRHNEPEGSTDFSSMDLDPADADVTRLPLFDLNDLPPSSDGGWSDSDDEAPRGPNDPDWDGIEGVGEYTGKWRMMKVKTKMDPPSSATRMRIEEWGRPISPFPKKIGRLELVGEEDEEMGGQQEKTLEDILTGNQEERDRREEEEVRRMSVEPEEYVVEDEDSRETIEVYIVPPEESQTPSSKEDDREEQDGIVEVPQGDGRSGQEEHIVQVEAQPVEAQTSLDTKRGSDIPEEAPPVQDESDDEQEELEVRQMSVGYEPEEEREERRENVPASIPTIVEGRYTSPEAGSSLASPNVWQDEDQQPRESSPVPPTSDVLSRESNHSATGIYVDKIVALRNLLVDEDTPMDNSTAVEDMDDDDDDDANDSSDSEEDGVVKITSADPRAAARAVAILKQYDYDCFTKIVMKRRHADAKRRRGSHSAVDDIAKEFRRKNLQGISKDPHTEKKRRRSTLGMGVIGDRVIIPGSPDTTIPNLLKEAEAEVVSVTTHTPGIWTRRVENEPRHDPFKTPLPLKYRTKGLSSNLLESLASDEREDGEKEWAKEEWKLLDGCFTDERLEVGHRLDLADDDGLAPVDIVRIESVVQRFIDMIGGDSIMSRRGEAWSRENMLRRAKALQNKQRAGHVAPPVTPFIPSGSVGFGGLRRMSAVEVPDFTPLRRRPAPPRKHRPVAATVPVTQEAEVPKKLPPSLLAPRYSHLLEEAIAISQEGTQVAPASPEEQWDDEQDEIEETESILATPDRADMEDDDDVQLIPPPTIGKRMKGFLFSYLPTLSKTPAPSKGKNIGDKPGLPVPPVNVLEKSRGPVETPVRPPIPKPKAPKELVQLHHATPPPKPSLIPRVKPRRLIDLRPAPPPPTPAPIPRPRRSSGGSVKDLVRNFEDMQARSSLDATTSSSLHKVRSVGELRDSSKNRPAWKP